MVKQKHGRKMVIKPLDNKVKRWWAFLSINGTCQHVKELTVLGARNFAVTQGYIGRYQPTTKPQPKRRRVRSKVAKSSFNNKSASPGTVPSALGWCPECGIKSMERKGPNTRCENGHHYATKSERKVNPVTSKPKVKKMPKHPPKKAAPAKSKPAAAKGKPKRK